MAGNTRVDDIKTSQELGLGEPKPGYEWHAGLTPPWSKFPGRWAVRRDAKAWLVLFHSFNFDSLRRPFNGPEYVIQTFPPTDEGERAAKKMACMLVDMAWKRVHLSAKVSHKRK